MHKTWPFGGERAALCAAIFVGALYASYGLWAAAHDTYLHDEGLLTDVFAAWTWQHPVPFLFFQKARPVASLLYLIPARVGLGSFFAVHVLVMAAVPPLLFAVARSLGFKRPLLPAVIVALSPLYIAAGPSGVTNGDGIAVSVLFLFLYVVVKRDAAAGIVLGAMTWVRFELAPLVILVVLFAAYEKRWRVLAGAAIFPVVYLVAGAVYHHDAVWWVHLPPSLASGMPGNPAWASERARRSAASFAEALVAITPLIGLAAFVRVSRLTRIERLTLVFVVLYHVAMNLLPAWEILNFGYSARYSVQSLPFIALLVGRVLDGYWDREPHSRLELPVLFVALAGGVLVWRGMATPTLAPLVPIAWALIVILSYARLGRLAVAASLLLAVAAPFAVMGRTQMLRTELAPYLDEVAVWMRGHPAEVRGHAVYTNVALLDAYLARSGSVPGVRAHFMFQLDQLYEIEHLTDEASGQREAVLASLRDSAYGLGVVPDEITLTRVPAGSLFVLRQDRRVEMIMTPEEWGPHLEIVVDAPRYRIARFVP